MKLGLQMFSSLYYAVSAPQCLGVSLNKNTKLLMNLVFEAY